MYLIVVLLIFLLFVLFTQKRDRFWECLNQIPQPPPYPIIGNLLDFITPSEILFTGNRKRGLLYYPIYKLNILGVGSVNIVNPEDAEVVLTDMKQNTKSILYNFLHSWLGTGLLTSAGAKWQTRRKILTPAFHFSILQEFVSSFVKNTRRLVDDLEKENGKECDVVSYVTHCTLLSIAESAMGVDLNSYTNDKNGYKQAVYDFGSCVSYRVTRPYIYSDFTYSFTSSAGKEEEAVKTLHTFSRSVIAEKKKNFTLHTPKKCLAMLDLLLKYKSGGANIDDEGIREEVDTFMFEGHDTTAMAMCMLLMLLANNRNHQDEIFKEIEEVVGDEVPTYAKLQDLKFMERCIKESLRLYPSVPVISRVSGSEIKTKTGYIIPENCMINIFIYDIHHNPNVFPDPERFDPDRFLPENIQTRHPFAYIPFSAGPRNCIGQKFAMLEMKTILWGVLKKFVLEPVDTPDDMVFVTDLVLRPKSSVKVKFVSRCSRNCGDN